MVDGPGALPTAAADVAGGQAWAWMRAVEPAVGSGPIDFHALGKAGPGEAEALCTAAFGTEDELGDLFGVGLTYRSGGGGRPCAYETDDGGTVVLSVLDFRPPPLPGFDLTALGERYAAVVSTVPPAPPALADPARRARLQAWLDGRAHAVVDDHDAWLATLPAVEQPYVAINGYELDPFGLAQPYVELTGRLVTPSRTIGVTGVRRVSYLRVREDAGPVRAGEGREFLLATLVSESNPGAAPADVTVRARVDGVDVGAVPLPADTVADSDVTTDLVLSVPVGATEVELVITTDGTEQAISLVDGTVRAPREGAR